MCHGGDEEMVVCVYSCLIVCEMIINVNMDFLLNCEFATLLMQSRQLL